LTTHACRVAGLKRVLRSIRPVVTRSGGSYVELGMLRSDIVEQIAEALGQPPSRPHAAELIWMRRLETGSGPGAVVAVPITESATSADD
jgi:hypothetical protein